MRKILAISLGMAGWVCGSGPLAAQELNQVAGRVQVELRQALEELAQLEQQIGAEKIPLAKKLNDLEQQVISKRGEYERRERESANDLLELNVLRKEVKDRTEITKYLESLFTDFRRRFEDRIDITEKPLYEEALAEVRAAVGNPDLATEEKLVELMTPLEISLKRISERLGGTVFPGSALTREGVVETGKFIMVGPVVVFASDQSEAAGVSQEKINMAKPVVVEIGPEFGQGIRGLAESGEGELPFDSSLGNALKISATEEGIIEHIRKGGPVMVPILLLGFTAMVICIVKYAQISRIHVTTPQQLQLILNYLNRGESGKAKAHAESIKGPVGEMLTRAIEHVGEKKEYIEEIMYERMLITKPRMERLMPIIALAAATAPLLGLLGTVTGMINTFNMITVFGTGDPKTLAGGISEALITTEFGLIVAVPSLLMHAFVSRKAKSILGSMEQTTVGFINGVPEPQKEERKEYDDKLLQ